MDTISNILTDMNVNARSTTSKSHNKSFMFPNYLLCNVVQCIHPRPICSVDQAKHVIHGTEENLQIEKIQKNTSPPYDNTNIIYYNIS